MYNLIWLICVLLIFATFLRWRSPLLLTVPHMIVAALNSPFSEGDTTSINLIMLGWILTLFLTAAFMRGRGISIGQWQEIHANYARLTPRRVFWMGVAGLALMAACAIWLSQAGVDQFGSAKRTRGGGAWLNLANALINVFTLHAVFVLSVFRIRLTNPHVLIAFLSVAVIVLIGYLSSSRSLFVVPIVTMFFVRLARVRSIKGRLQLVSMFVLVAAAGITLMALISAERRGVEGLGAGFSILSGQVAQSETGHGLSPAKDALVWEYSERKQIPEVGLILLGGVYGLIPRALWPGKPVFVSTGPVAGAFVFRGQSSVDVGAGIPISFPSEVVLAFGSAWFLPGLFASGFLMVLVAELLRKYPLLLFASFSFYSGIISYGLPKSQTDLLLDVLTLLIMARITGITISSLGKTAHHRQMDNRKETCHEPD